MKAKVVALVVGLMLVASISVMAYSPKRTRIVKLCEKDTTTGECLKGVKEWEMTPQGGRLPVRFASGYARYKEQQADTFSMFLSTSHLDRNKEYQVTLNGQFNMSGNDLLYQTALGDPDPYSGGCWDGTSNRRDVVSCDAIGGEGFYNIHMGTLGSLRNNKYVMHDYITADLEEGVYEGVKLLVKDNQAPWATHLCETGMLNFEII